MLSNWEETATEIMRRNDAEQREYAASIRAGAFNAANAKLIEDVEQIESLLSEDFGLNIDSMRSANVYYQIAQENLDWEKLSSIEDDVDLIDYYNKGFTNLGVYKVQIENRYNHLSVSRMMSARADALRRADSPGGDVHRENKRPKNPYFN